MDDGIVIVWLLLPIDEDIYFDTQDNGIFGRLGAVPFPSLTGTSAPAATSLIRPPPQGVLDIFCSGGSLEVNASAANIVQVFP
jgi:hypothetical protein